MPQGGFIMQNSNGQQMLVQQMPASVLGSQNGDRYRQAVQKSVVLPNKMVQKPEMDQYMVRQSHDPATAFA